MSWAIHSQPPSVKDTHCVGAGLLPSTRTWSTPYKLMRQYTDNGDTLPFPPKVDLSGKNVLISGSNSGLGERAAYRFALWGAHVILACRDPPPHEPHPEKVIEDMLRESKGQIKPEQLEWWKVDFSSFDSVQALGQRWLDTGKPLDILCNNAGLSTGKFIITKDGVELTRSVNFLGHALLTLVLLPAMKKSAAPKVINTVSCFHYGGRLDFSSLDYEKGQGRGIGGVRAYCDTKLLFMMWTKELQERLSRSEDYRHVIVNGVHPGFVSSNIWQDPNVQGLPWPLPLLQGAILKARAIDVTQGSLCILYGALHPQFGFRPSELQDDRVPFQGESAERGGNYIDRDTAKVPRPEVEDVLARSRLWQRTMEDLKVEERGLGKDVPGHLTGLN